jgi:hypothetical protein
MFERVYALVLDEFKFASRDLVSAIMSSLVIDRAMITWSRYMSCD